MIILFHCASLLLTHIFNERKRQKALLELSKIQQDINEINNARTCAYKDAELELRFDPPVYRQRYGTIHEVLLNAKWRKNLKKVVEFGCAELGLFIYLKNLVGITEINFVDIDEFLLKDNLFRVRPLTIEYLRKRFEPLVVNVFAGSIIDPDRRILNSDVVIGIEIIEHLYPDILDAVPYAIFHCTQPKIAIFTTPNADFNALLPNLKGFRHLDHKFEWTRKQFEEWAINITHRFPQYFASFHGIGNGPEGTESLGCCSQMVVFIRRDMIDPSYTISTAKCYCQGTMQSRNNSECADITNWNYCSSCCPMKSHGICTYSSYSNHLENYKIESQNIDQKNLIFYKLLQMVEYPYEIDQRTPEQRMLDEVKYKIYTLGSSTGRFFNEERMRAEIPVTDLTSNCDGQFISVQEIITLLSSQGFQLEECTINEERDGKDLCVIFEPEMDNFSSSESEASGYESGHSRFLNQASLSDWNDDGSSNEREGQKAPHNGAVFPDWLLQMLRTNFPTESEGPHFYCQGDGLGVHPSMIAVETDENDDASSESSSTNGSATLAETDNENSTQDVVSLCNDSSLEPSCANNGQPSNDPIFLRHSNEENCELTLHNDDSEEYFDTSDEMSIVSGKLTK